MITQEQRDQRKRYVGASDMAALFGLDPHGRNAHDLYLDKTGQLPDSTPTKAMELGTRLEGYVLDWAEEGDDDWDGVGALVRSPRVLLPPPHAHLIAHCDAVTKRDTVPVEAKTHWFGQTAGQWGAPGSDQVPDHVKIQLHAQMLCIGADLGWVVALLGRGLSHFLIPRDESVCDLILETAKRFWEEHVIPRVPPPDVLPSLDSLKVLRREPKKRVELSGQLLVNWETMRSVRKATEEKETRAKAALLTALGDAEEATFDYEGEGELLALIGKNEGTLPMITYYEQTRRSVDTKRLFAEHPELKEAYETTSTHRVLREKKA